jgi:hypothetical protein
MIVIKSLILWSGFLALRTALILIGWVVVPIAVHCGAVSMRLRELAGKDVEFWYFTWPWMFLWGNEEEGIAWYGEGSVANRIIYSSCYRNPCNNLRYVPWLSLKIDPTAVRWLGSGVSCINESSNLILRVSQYYKAHIFIANAKGTLGDYLKTYDSDAHDFWYFAWHGHYSCYRRHFTVLGRRYRFWLGWKIYPQDIYGVFDHRKESAGFATQFKRIA